MPIRDILLDDNGERVLVGNDYGFATGRQAVKQGIECAVRLYQGDVWYDLDAGVPYVQRLLVKGTPRMVAEAEIGSAILGVADVLTVDATDYSVDASRKATVSFVASTTEGVVDGTVSP